MSVAIVVAVTRMREGRRCVGALEVDPAPDGYIPLRNLRLHKSDGAYFHVQEFPFHVGQILEVEYTPSPNRRLPHTEDCRVHKLHPTGELQPPLADAIMAIISRNSVVPVYKDSIDSTFEGILEVDPDTGIRSVSQQGGIPNFSTCFWIAHHEVEVWRTSEGRVRLRSEAWNISVPYVGESPLVEDLIPAGSLLRLSLSRWWRKTPDALPRCYLQVSQYYGVLSSQ